MRRTQVLMAAMLLATPAPLLAQSGVNDTDEPVEQNDDDGNPRTGLLGLLGLLGLFGLMRREPNIHVDARRRGGSANDGATGA